MKTIAYMIGMMWMFAGLHAQVSVDEILASNDINTGKVQHMMTMDEFANLDAESLDGTFRLLSSDSSISEVRSFSKGKLDGTWVQYGENHNLLAIANYRNNQKHGKWTIWDENGTKRYEMMYENGERKGTWSQWNEDGELVTTKVY